MQYSFVQGCKYLIATSMIDQSKIDSIAQKFALSPVLAQALCSRNMQDQDSIQNYLYTSASQVHDPALLKDGQKAVDRILQAIEKQERILIFGDYDVDGITSSSLMMMGLLPLGAKVNFFLPNRVKDGYGLSSKIVQKAYDNGYKVIITVDNGITAFEPAALALKLGIDLIITDHHKPHDHVPQAYAIVNPHQNDCSYPYKYFAGVGVAFKILSLLYQKTGKQIPDKVIELLLLGTVADVVPLTGENRYWVRQGLQHVNNHESLSLSVLKSNSQFCKPSLTSIDVGFSITPQINALGRLDDAREGVQFLIGNNASEIERIGRILLEMNVARKQIEKSIVDEIVQQIESGVIDISKNVVVASSKNWPAGVIGLVASRIVAAYGRPTLLFHITKDGIAKGSCRSIKEFNVFQALSECKELLIAFGGHAHAAGLSLKVENVAILTQRLQAKIATELTEFDLKQKIVVDATCTLSNCDQTLMEQLKLFEPFGHENPQPIFYIQGVVLVSKPQILKELHVKCSVFADGVVRSVIFFNRPDLFEVLVHLSDQQFNIVGQVMHNYFNGVYSIEIQGLDVVL